MSVLIQGLDGVRGQSKQLDALVEQLVDADIQLQHWHEKALKDCDEGHHVVDAYRHFLDVRTTLVSELQSQDLSVPWQLRLTVTELEVGKKTSNSEKDGPKKKLEDGPLGQTNASRKGRYVSIGMVLLSMVVLFMFDRYGIRWNSWWNDPSDG